tara:strand:+ start:5283 stop:5888 length:606 start_codon:yes stop_codon:yes gene_type:complete
MEDNQTNPVDQIDSVEMTDADIHEELKARGVKLHHKTGSEKLKATLEAVMSGTYQSEEKAASTAPTAVPSVKELTAEEHLSKLTKEQKAMRLTRVVVSPNDPLMSAYPGLIFTVGSSSINNGRMIKKFVPFNNDDGWHVPKIILDQIESAEMQKFRQVISPNGEKSLQPYITKKFNVQILDPLSQGEMEILAASQASKGAA